MYRLCCIFTVLTSSMVKKIKASKKKELLTDHDRPHYSTVMLRVVYPAINSAVCSAGLKVSSHLGLLIFTLRFLIRVTVVGNSPFSSGGFLPPSSPLSISVSAHFAFRALCTQLVRRHFIKSSDTQYSHFPPGGICVKQHSTESLDSERMSGQIQKSLSSPFLALFLIPTSPFNCPPLHRNSLN